MANKTPTTDRQKKTCYVCGEPFKAKMPRWQAAVSPSPTVAQFLGRSLSPHALFVWVSVCDTDFWEKVPLGRLVRGQVAYTKEPRLIPHQYVPLWKRRW